MGLLQRVARARLAGRVLRRLRSVGVSDIGYDAATFSVRFTPVGHDGPAVLRLENLLAELSGSRRNRRTQIARFVDGFARLPDLPRTWDEICPRLRPILRGITPVSTGAPLRRAALPFLGEFVVVDQPDTMTYVVQGHLAEWGVTADDVFAAARANLSVTVRQPASAAPVVLRFVDDGDAYWTSHLLLDGWLAGLAEQVGGEPVAFAPDRGTLLVAAADSADLPALFALAEETYLTSPRAISPVAYVSGRGGRVVGYQPAAGHPLHRRVQRAERLLAVHEYAHQGRLLAAGGIPPAPLVLLGSADEGWRTRALWPHDTAVLLPTADEVLAGATLLPWPALLPRLVEDPELVPPRWHASAWPA